jgi:hypothetical protein
MSEGFLHYCHCGKWGAFGYNVRLLKGQEGSWYCREHKPGWCDDGREREVGQRSAGTGKQAPRDSSSPTLFDDAG